MALTTVVTIVPKALPVYKSMTKSRTPPPRSKALLLLDAAIKRQRALYEQGRHEESLDICLQLTRTHPGIAGVWGDAAANCLKLGRWQDAIRYSQTAQSLAGKSLGSNALPLYDALAHAHTALGQWDEARRYGLQALNIRAERFFNSEPVIPLPKPGPLPPLPSADTRERNIIAFSLFGGNSKYCEPAVLNVQEQPQVYPHWVCRFYVDASVPDHVINRLRAGGAQVVLVEGAAAQWPGPMWRFLALDDRQAHRVIFRDADSVISQREAGAVEQWLSSGKQFHIMRDWGAHTELMLAGMWGVVAGSLPSLEQLMRHFMSAPLESRHFADQYFLRRLVWPYARQSLMQHDSVFGFMDGIAFPDGEKPSKSFHVGCSQNPPFSAKSNLPDGSAVTWSLYLMDSLDDGQTRETLVCTYPTTVKDGQISANIPYRYALRVDQDTACVRLSPVAK